MKIYLDQESINDVVASSPLQALKLRLESPTMIGIQGRTISGVVSLPPNADRNDVHRRSRGRYILMRNRSPPVT